ncbi:peptide/nickel transport system substrate-binding protein [Rubricella aquisinus]|uniref:Peptide/nickel transport system substrate-binding protein n=1 Tax=Rubricella aquisinus TaxID=2028108 RepID=A0A840WNI3_9RHOB|nr:ABC transporter substrate-binding protein [Rubricella aquisinus]MBB5515653.1 peptide/nickel transport system substrate-binding protein [Rubricella aquisinus]
MRHLKTAALAVSVSVMAMTAAQAAGHGGKTIKWTSQGDALTLDPHSQNEGPTTAMNGLVYESLVTRDPELNLVPELATSWEPTEDGWMFKLREGVTFHGGEALTAGDVAFSINRAKQETSDFRTLITSVTGVRVIDDYTVELVTDGPNPILPNQLTNIFIMDSGWATENNVVRPQDYAASEETFSIRNANGTGPYIITERLPEEMTVLEANADWWGAGQFPGNVTRIEYRPITNAATRVAALLSGEVDFVLDPPLQDLERIGNTDGLRYETVAQIRSIFFGYDQGAEELRTSNIEGANPFADVRVRKAVSLAIDRNAIQRVVMDGLSVPGGMVASPGVLGWNAEHDTPPAVDIAAAQALMAEAGYGDGFSVRLDCPNNRYNNDEAICQAAVSMLARIGIDVTLDALPRSQHFPKIQNRETDFYLLGWGVPTLDSHYIFSFLMQTGGSWNATGYSDPELDALVEAMLTETDIPARTAMIEQAWDIVQAAEPYTTIHHQVLAWGLRDGVTVPMAADDTPRFRYAVVE